MYTQFLWLVCLLSFGAILRGGKTQASPGVLAAKVARGTCATQLLPHTPIPCLGDPETAGVMQQL